MYLVNNKLLLLPLTGEEVDNTYNTEYVACNDHTVPETVDTHIKDNAKQECKTWAYFHL